MPQSLKHRDDKFSVSRSKKITQNYTIILDAITLSGSIRYSSHYTAVKKKTYHFTTNTQYVNLSLQCCATFMDYVVLFIQRCHERLTSLEIIQSI